MSDPFEHIDEYINNRLSVADRLAFDGALQSDAALQFAVNEYHLAKEISLSFLDAEVLKILKDDNPKNNKKNRNLWLYILASIVLMGLVIFGYKYGASKRYQERVIVAMSDYTPPQVVFVRGDGDIDPTDTLLMAKTTFSKKDFASCIGILESAHLKTNQQDEKYYLLSHATFILGDYQKTTLYISQIKDNTPYQSELGMLSEKVAFILLGAKK